MRRRLLRPITAIILSGTLVVGPMAPEATAAKRSERKMYRLINGERYQRGIRTLDLRRRLTRMARRHSKKMAERGYVYHSRCLSCRMRGSNWSKVGENVGAGKRIRRVHRAFMRNSSHRSNILDRAYRRVGVGIVHRRGRVWITQIFVG